jgi:phenylacetate-CoA ligase
VAGFKRRLGAGVVVDVRLVDKIPAEKSGKYRYIVSHAV